MRVTVVVDIDDSRLSKQYASSFVEDVAKRLEFEIYKSMPKAIARELEDLLVGKIRKIEALPLGMNVIIKKSFWSEIKEALKKKDN